MKIIVTTPVNIKFSYVVLKYADEKLEDFAFYKALHSTGKHLFIEYDENNENLLKSLYDLDAMGLSNITSVEEFEKLFHTDYYCYKD